MTCLGLPWRAGGTDGHMRSNHLPRVIILHACMCSYYTSRKLSLACQSSAQGIMPSNRNKERSAFIQAL